MGVTVRQLPGRDGGIPMADRTVAISEIGPTVYEEGKAPTVQGRPLEEVRAEASAANVAAAEADAAEAYESADESASSEAAEAPADGEAKPKARRPAKSGAKPKAAKK